MPAATALGIPLVGVAFIACMKCGRRRRQAGLDAVARRAGEPRQR
jgi:hypothetical protein